MSTEPNIDPTTKSDGVMKSSEQQFRDSNSKQSTKDDDIVSYLTEEQLSQLTLE